MSCCFSVPACNYRWSLLQIPCSLSFTPSALFLFPPFVVLFHPVCRNLKNSLQIERKSAFKSDKALTGKTRDWKITGNKEKHFSLSAVSNNSLSYCPDSM